MTVAPARRRAAGIETLTASAFSIPTDRPESDGTLEWDRTTLILVEVESAGQRGVGYSYGAAACVTVVRDHLESIAIGADPLCVTRVWEAMVRAVRNVGRPGIASHAIAAVDAALWDLKAKLLDVPLVTLIGQVRDEMPVYGSGGFTSYSEAELHQQLAGWVDEGIGSVKMKVGRDPERDVERVRRARQAVGVESELFVDANGAYDRKQALAYAEQFASYGVSWFEEPVSSDDLDGLRLLRDRGPEGMAIAAGEYGYDLPYFRRMIEAGAVDVLQADATRCAGITGFLEVAALCEASGLPLSAHTAPALHLAPCCAVRCARNIEYFHDHVRIERGLFEGMPPLVDGRLRPDLTRPGLGLTFKRADAKPYAIT